MSIHPSCQCRNYEIVKILIEMLICQWHYNFTYIQKKKNEKKKKKLTEINPKWIYCNVVQLVKTYTIDQPMPLWGNLKFGIT